MRVAIFTDTYAPEINGVAKTLGRFAEYLEKKKVPFQIFAPEIDTTIPTIHQVVRFSSLPFLLYPESRIAIPNPIRINKILRNFKPTILHIATPFNLGVFGMNYGKKQGIPMVASYHTNFDEYLEYYNLQFLNKWIWNYMKWFHHPFKKVFVPSIDTKQKLVNKKLHPHLEIWPRGVDHQLFSPLKRNSAILKKYGITEKYIILYVGRIAPEKDLQIAIDAFNALPPSIRNESHFIIAGDGPLFKSLSEKSYPQITFTGFINGEELAQLYATSDLLLFPSTTETFGNVVLEAHASGVPVVGANAGGVREIVRDELTGKLCTPKDTSHFTTAIKTILENPALLASMKNEARQLSLLYSWDEIFRNLLNQYNDVIASSNNKQNSRIHTQPA